MKKKQLLLNYKEYDSVDELPESIQKLINHSIDATNQSYAPYSEFNVGASVLLENGEIIDGSNQENSAYPSGLCAERVAMFYANSKFPELAVEAISITAKEKGNLIKDPAAPCGSCRQVLLETENRYKKPIVVYLVGEDKIIEIEKVHDLLPISFDGEFLKGN